jgi:hypothetical protein
LITQSIDDYVELESGYGVPEQLYMEQLKSALIAAAIDKHVNQYEQLAVRLRLYEGYTQEQTATIFNAMYPERIFTVELIKSYIYSAKQKLKKILPTVLADWYPNVDARDAQITEDEKELIEETLEVAPLWQRVVHTDPMEDPIYALTWAQVQEEPISDAFYDALGKRIKAFFEGSQK